MFGRLGNCLALYERLTCYNSSVELSRLLKNSQVKHVSRSNFMKASSSKSTHQLCFFFCLTAKELKLKARELTQAERKASNLSEDLTREKQKFQRLLSSGGSSVEDALAPRTGRGGRRNASLLTEGSVMAHDPDSPSEQPLCCDVLIVTVISTIPDADLHF